MGDWGYRYTDQNGVPVTDSHGHGQSIGVAEGGPHAGDCSVLKVGGQHITHPHSSGELSSGGNFSVKAFGFSNG